MAAAFDSTAFDAAAFDSEAVAGASVNPGAAAVVLAGYAPTVARTASQGVTPGAGTLVLTGYAPTVTQSSASAITPAPATVLLTGYAPTVARTTSLTVSPAPGLILLTGFVPTVTQTGQPEVPPPSGGGGGYVRDVRAYAKRLSDADKPEKRSRSEKRKRRRQLEDEALELLPDLPEAEAFAPIVARLVFEQEARAIANWTPVRAMVPLAFNAEQALREQIAAWMQQIEHQKDIDDEHDLELLLLG